MVLTLNKQGPKMQEDRVAWNASWERVLKGKLGDFTPPDLLSGGGIPNTAAGNDALLTYIRERTRDLCNQQHIMCVPIRILRAHGIESRWPAERMTVKVHHVLEGLVRACTPYDMSRWWCEEITIPNILANKGQPFLDLMRSVEIADPHCTPATPVLVPNERFDRLVGKARLDLSDRQRYLQEMWIIERNCFICKFVQFTLSSVFGLPYISRPFRKGPYLKELEADLRNKHGRQAAAEILGVARCEHCYKSADQLPSRQDMKSCLPCHQLGRRYYYCSRQCQKKDYKTRHKAICGKEFTLDEAKAFAVRDPSIVPQPSLPIGMLSDTTMPWNLSPVPEVEMSPEKKKKIEEFIVNFGRLSMEHGIWDARE